MNLLQVERLGPVFTLSLISISLDLEADEPLFASFPVNADRIFSDSNGSAVSAARPSRISI